MYIDIHDINKVRKEKKKKR